jgi:hypothetical protein
VSLRANNYARIARLQARAHKPGNGVDQDGVVFVEMYEVFGGVKPFGFRRIKSEQMFTGQQIE